MAFDAGFLYIHAITAVAITILLKTKKTKRCFQAIIEFEERLFKNEGPEVLAVYLKQCRSTNSLCVFLGGTIIATAVAWFVIGIRESYTLVPTDTCPFIRGAVFQLWYPFSTEKYAWACTVYDTFFILITTMLFTYYKTAPLNLILFVISQIKILQYKVTVICKNSNPEEISANIKECLRDHQDAIRKKILCRESGSYVDYSCQFHKCIYFFGMPTLCKWR
nr:unnamed protein product [Callosobruchus chinensis]